MKVMVLGMATEQSESGDFGAAEDFAAMDQYMRQLTEAGVLLAGDGLQPTSKAKRVVVDTDGARVIDGPFAESKEFIAGYTLIQVKTREEAMEWAKRFPAPHGPNTDAEIEVRQLFELDDFTPSEAIDRFKGLGVGTQK